MKGKTHRFKVGNFDCIAVSDGTHVYAPPVFPPPAVLLFTNAPQEELERTLFEHNIQPAGWAEWVSPYLCLLVDTGQHRVLVDTGANGLDPSMKGVNCNGRDSSSRDSWSRGGAGTAHATAFSRLPGVEVTTLWSRTRARAEELASRLDQPGIQIYDHWQDLIARAEVDVISIATPEMLRRAPVAMALERGRHVLVEKPLSIELADAQEMVQLAQDASTVTATCFNWRYAPGAQVAWREVQAGRIGRLLDIQMEWRFGMSPRQFLEWLPWSADVSTGSLGLGGSHEFDRARFLTGCEFTHLVGRVVPFSLSQEPGYTVNCGAYMLLAELTDEVLAQFRVTLTTGQPKWDLVLHGEEGTLEVTHQAVLRRCAGEDEAVSLKIPESDLVPEGVTRIQHVWNRLIADFITAVRRGDVAHATVPHLATLVDGLRTQEVITAARRSEDERRWVDFRKEFGMEGATVVKGDNGP